MSKESGGDIFGMDADVEVSETDAAENAQLVIHQIIAADADWRAVFEHPDAAEPKIVPLACFALVAVHHSNVIEHAVRPMIADEDGRVDDVEMFDGFYCLVPPGADADEIIAAVRRQRASEGEGKVAEA
jgi:hypothetical protein